MYKYSKQLLFISFLIISILGLLSLYTLYPNDESIYYFIFIAFIINIIFMWLYKSIDYSQKLQKSVEAKTQEYKALFENSPVPYVIVDKNLLILESNQMFEKYFSKDNKEEFTNLITFIDTNLKDEFIHHFDVNEYEKSPIITAMRTKEKKLNKFKVDIVKHVKEKEQYIVSLTDVEQEITLLHQVRQANNLLQQEYEKFNLAIQGSESGLFEWNLKKDQIYFSPRWYDIIGQKVKENHQTKEEWFALIHTDDLEFVQKAFKKYFKEPIALFNITFRVQHKNGSWIWINARAKVSEDIYSQAKRMIGFLTDVTELTEYKNQLEEKVNTQIEELREKNEQILQNAKMVSMGEMIGNIAHQWRQPLSTISIKASTIAFKNESNLLDLDELNQEMETIVETANYLSKTIDTFKNFLKEDKELIKMDLQDVVCRSIDIVKPNLDNNYIELRKNIPEELIQVQLTQGELEEVIINIVNNAKDALIENQIKNPLIQLTLKEDDSYAIITIEDNGGGIPNDIIPRIFEPYFTTKHKSQGTGLGLHIVYKIIKESLNGDITVHNSNNGAIFTIKLPTIL